ncbi:MULTISPECIES: NADPH:quinone reductase [unclassified Chelatococcus]|jgi:NADPH2:quinone reductase|uniref:NADPH:quinone reductase n=2 Tax=Chelatococcus TaxID=28209 RepID=UPI001BCFB95D|nr:MULTISPECIES: NADPH:quinone reductase [unclassified Chelatococcus]CAH1651428.1 NADPH:quinone reductase-like Zn-dependent oxidoreductase [Hyphomicrobiales bacterium]MBS7743172.1 NADPH:quinone reductase [Chelatococcus sp. HY11]MBX3541710.1 NADPH:quinone reductase [Chelatococcus sp.]MCO5074398.1 NADPH:quinone reductase [Chelatococcus sp.]CAH1693232.1 NADPH:quinone reductase-like Zn-dependent oxidoreductase [Hyphomicrobiales bacterium]
MRAAFFDSFGPPDVLMIDDIDQPELRPGEVLMRVVASGINPSDVKRRAGWGGAAWPGHRIVAHCDGAGDIVAAADALGQTWVGRRAWVWSVPGRTFLRQGIEYGTAAEWLAVPVANLAPLPDRVDYRIGACLGVPAITAHYAVFADGPVAGKTVLVQGGGGAVGELAVQMAKAAGAYVIATARTEARAAIARAAGAELVVDVSQDNAGDLVLASRPDGVDRVIEVDFGANVDFNARIVATGGTIVSYSSTSCPNPVIPYYALQRKAALIRLLSNYILPVESIRAAIDHVAMMLETGGLRPTIAMDMPLDAIVAAHEAVEARTPGKVVLHCAR